MPPPTPGGSPAQGSLAEGLRGAALLARGDATGLALVDGTPEGAARSFRVALVCLPAFVILRLLAWATATPPTGGYALGLAAEVVGFVIAWAGFALASLPATEAVGRRARWPLFIAAWNYTNLVQYGLLVLVGGVPLLLGLPTGLAQVLGLIAFGYVIWLEWFVARIALNLPGLQAAGIVLIDVMISVFVAGLVTRLSAG
ncbi:MAG: hypothetical protein K2X74_20690 [Acetobacteraceae bacterium]|nr:hypothetical protein [Acetobacteraceae bacterium]